jgi:hypothetical protein
MSRWPGLELARSLLWRERRGRGAQLIIGPVCYGLGLIVLAVALAHVPGALTPITRHALERHAVLYLGTAPTGWGLSLALLVLQGPYMIALFAGASGGTARGLLGAEISCGGFELLVGAGYRVGDVFVGLLATSCTLALLESGLLAATALGPPLIALAFSGAPFTLPPQFVAMALLLPAPLVVWSSLLTLYFGIALAPRWQAYVGSLRRLPVLVLLVVMNLRPDLDPIRVGIVAISLAITGSLLVTYLLGRRCRIEQLLVAA